MRQDKCCKGFVEYPFGFPDPARAHREQKNNRQRARIDDDTKDVSYKSKEKVRRVKVQAMKE